MTQPLIKWNRKHAKAVYVPYQSKKEGAPNYHYFRPAHLGEGTDFSHYLAALSAGLVIFDPGSKVMNASKPKSSVKARSQFRIPVKHLDELYQQFGPVDF